MSKMVNIYSELYSALKTHGVRSAADMHLLLPKIGKQGERSFHLRKEIFDAMGNAAPHVETSLEPVKGIKLFIHVNNNMRLTDSSIMKSLVFGEKVVLISKEFRKVRLKKDKDKLKTNTKGTFAMDHDYGIDHGFIEALLRYKDLVDKGLLLIKPDFNKVISPINKQDYISKELKVSMNAKSVFDNFTDTEKTIYKKRIGFGLLKIPTISNVKVSDVVAMREEKNKSFQRFQFQLSKLLDESKKEHTDEQKLNSLIYSIQDKISDLDDQVKEYHSKHKYRLATSVIGTAAACICAYSSKNNSEHIATLMGTTPAISFLSVFNDIRADYRAIVNNDFYFPWKINASLGKII